MLQGLEERRESKDPRDLKGRRDPIQGAAAYAEFPSAQIWIPREKGIRAVVEKNEPGTSTSKGRPLLRLLARLKKPSA